MSSIPSDYDVDAGRFSAAQVGPGDVHDTVGPRLVALAPARVLDLGSVETDGRKARGDAAALPFATGSFDGVAALCCLYHFDDPALPIAEAHRVLRTGGSFVTCAPSRRDAPELVLHHSPSTFDAEEAEALVADRFGAANVTAEWWDGPYVSLVDDAAVERSVRGHLLQPDQLRTDGRPPLTLTKRGVVVWATKV